MGTKARRRLHLRYVWDEGYCDFQTGIVVTPSYSGIDAEAWLAGWNAAAWDKELEM